MCQFQYLLHIVISEQIFFFFFSPICAGYPIPFYIASYRIPDLAPVPDISPTPTKTKIEIYRSMPSLHRPNASAIRWWGYE